MDGNYLVSGSYANAVHIWEFATGQIALTLIGHGPGSAVAVSPDGRTIASGNGEYFQFFSDNSRKIRYWDLETGRELAHHAGHDENVTAMAFSPDGQWLATGLRDSTTLIWEVPDEVRNRPRETKTLTETELKRAWQDLEAEDAEKAYLAMAVLAAGGNATVDFLGQRVKPMREMDAKTIDPLLLKLDHADFAVRSQAQEKLMGLGDLAIQRLQNFAAQSQSLEAKKRCQAVLEKLQRPFITTPARLRNVRAIQVLGRIDTPESQKLLKAIGEGTPAAKETQQAQRQLKTLRQSRQK